MIELSLHQAVEKFGTETQKKSLLEGKKWRKESNECLIKTLKQHYQVVVEKGRGKKKVFILDKPFEITQKREDKRKNNGENQIPYEYELNSLVLDYILNHCKNNFVSMPLSRWLINIGLVDEKIILAYRKGYVVMHLKELQKKYKDRFTEKELVMLQHFIDTETKRLKRNLANVFHKLSKANIIRYKKEMYGCQLNNEHRSLSNSEITTITKYERKLCEKHNVSIQDLTFKNTPAVKEYKKELEAFLSEMELKYVYDSHACLVRVSDKIINQYLNKLAQKNELVISYGLNKKAVVSMINSFKDNYTDHSLDLARKRQNKLNASDHLHIKQLKFIKEYLPMWELLLIFYEMTNYIEPRLINENNTDFIYNEINL